MPDVLLGDRYRPLERLAVGGMGEVWRAEDTLLGRPVAIKILRPEYADDPGFRGRFRDEARHAAMLAHPNVTQVFDFNEGDGDQLPYIVMEFVTGEPLSELLRRSGALPDAQTWSILGQTAAALAAAHRAGVVHRDIKPGNILICPDGRLKVTDFGIARVVNQSSVTQTGLLLGTAQYLAPEQVAGESATPATDMYSLGIVGYECVTGRPPYEGDNIAVLQAIQNGRVPKVPTTVSPGLRDLIESLLDKDPARRPSDGDAVAAQAQRLGADTTTDETAAYTPYPVDEGSPGGGTPFVAGGSTQVLQHAATPSGPAAGDDIEPTAEPPRHDRRRVLLLVGALATAAVLAAVLVLVVRGGGGSHSGTTAARRTSPSSTPSHALTVASAVGYPGGSDHPEELPLAIDHSKSTAWMTEHYASAAFGNLKSGTGVVFTVRGGSARTVTITFAQPGISAQLFAGNHPAGRPVAATQSAPGVWRIHLDPSVHSSSWLVWITKLVPDGGGYRAGIADIRFTA
ncbi:MAG TPA: serine/threonine-protein kinase [Mycobacteriales bacterium]|nr:serine/threonine-protein kinase [Mycobacteriales bacterium]